MKTICHILFGLCVGIVGIGAWPAGLSVGRIMGGHGRPIDLGAIIVVAGALSIIMVLIAFDLTPHIPAASSRYQDPDLG